MEFRVISERSARFPNFSMIRVGGADLRAGHFKGGCDREKVGPAQGQSPLDHEGLARYAEVPWFQPEFPARNRQQTL